MKKLGLALVSLAALAASSMWGCGGDSAGDPTLPEPLVRFFNLVPDAGLVDYWLNDETRFAGIDYLGATSGFVETKFIPAEDGGYDISVGPNSGGEEYDRISQQLEKNTSTLFLAFGLKNFGPDDSKRIQALAFVVDRTRPNGAKARLLVLNALHQAVGIENKQVDFQTFDPNDPTSILNPLFKLANLNYGELDANVHTLTIDSGNWTFRAQEAQADSINVYAQRNVTLDAGKIYLAVISGVVDEAGDLAPKITFIEIAPKD